MSRETLCDALDRYLEATARLGSPVRELVRPLSDQESLGAFRALDDVTLPDELIAYFCRIDGYDDDALAERECSSPTLAWSMEALSVDDVLREHRDLQFAITKEARTIGSTASYRSSRTAGVRLWRLTALQVRLHSAGYTN